MFKYESDHTTFWIIIFLVACGFMFVIFVSLMLFDYNDAFNTQTSEKKEGLTMDNRKSTRNRKSDSDKYIEHKLRRVGGLPF